MAACRSGDVAADQADACCAANGITTIHVDFLAANREVAQLVRDAGGRPTVEAGVAQDDLLIDPALVERLDDE